MAQRLRQTPIIGGSVSPISIHASAVSSPPRGTSAIYLLAARAGVDTVALGSATGSQGMIYRKLAHTQPWFDRGGTRVYPTYHVIAGVAAASGARRIDTDSSAPSKVTALAYRSKGDQVLWLANLSRRDPAREGQGLRWPCQTAMFSTKEALKQRCAIPPGSTAAAPSSARVGSLELPSAWVARIRAANVHMLLGCVPAISLRAAVEK